MHADHAILVNIPEAARDANKPLNEMTKNEIQEMVIDYATEATDIFFCSAFDYRSLLENQPVIFSGDDWNVFEEKLLEIDKCQKGYAMHLLNYLEKEAGSTNVSDILRTLLLVNDRTASRDSVDPQTWRWDYMNQGAWALFEISKVIHGSYTFDSLFFDTWRSTALVPFIGQLKETPNDWALVQFDYHY